MAAAGAGAPVIDAKCLLAPENSGAPPPAEVARAIGQACKEWGCFQLVNHGLDLSLTQRMEAAMHAFFALPKEHKLRVPRTATNASGYFDGELTKQSLDLKEGFDFFHLPHPELPDDHPDNRLAGWHNVWLDDQPEFEAAMKAWLREMERCSFKLLEAFCLGLGLPAEALHPVFQRDHTSMCRLNRYPVTPDDGQNRFGVHHHTDSGFLTILLQCEAVPGLEAFHGGEWHLVQPVPGGLTVNVGDMCCVASNGIVEPCLHRVVSPHTDRVRYSVPYFFSPRSEAIIAPLPELTGPQRPPAYRPFKYGDFRAARFAGDYADLGEEVQISWYRTEQ